MTLQLQRSSGGNGSDLPANEGLIGELRQLIDGARLRCNGAAVAATAEQLRPVYGQGFAKANLHRMV